MASVLAEPPIMCQHVLKRASTSAKQRGKMFVPHQGAAVQQASGSIRLRGHGLPWHIVRRHRYPSSIVPACLLTQKRPVHCQSIQLNY
eukprot:scaffold83650_cov15-Tisochrysis_lutea.AAC.1